MKKYIALLLIFGLFATACPVSDSTIGPPFWGWSKHGFTTESGQLNPEGEGCTPLIEYYGDCDYHPYPAVDFILPHGKPVVAVAPGTIALVGEETDDNPDAWPRKPGRFILLELKAPRGDCRYVRYSHLSDWAVAEGQTVTRGQFIGRAGSTQIPGNETHLHLDCFSSVEGFNTYEAQADLGEIQWYDRGRCKRVQLTSFAMGRWSYFQHGPTYC